jgi:hypothetical protein
MFGIRYGGYFISVDNYGMRSSERRQGSWQCPFGAQVQVFHAELQLNAHLSITFIYLSICGCQKKMIGSKHGVCNRQAE